MTLPFGSQAAVQRTRGAGLIVSTVLHVLGITVLMAFRGQDADEQPQPKQSAVHIFAPRPLAPVRLAKLRAPALRKTAVVPPSVTPRVPSVSPVALPEPPKLLASSTAPQIAIAPVEAPPPPPPVSKSPVLPAPASTFAAAVNQPLRISARPAMAAGAFEATQSAPRPASKVMAGSPGAFDGAAVETARSQNVAATAGGFSAAATVQQRSVRSPVQPSTAFGEVRTADPRLESRNGMPALAAETPVRITSKPKPAYTEEARRLRIEGAVILQVTFAASGSVHILRVVQGLGYGLDESAALAARSLVFQPARRDGRPVDVTANLRIEFQLTS